MKKTLLVSLLLVFSAATFAGTFDLGIKASYNTTKLSTDLSTIKADASNGYNIGAFGRFGGKALYFQPEFLYNVKSGDFTQNAIKYAVDMKFIQVPMLLGLNVINGKLISLHAFTGPAVSFSTGYNADQNLKMNMNGASWDYQLGGGVDVGIFTFDLRYEWGLSKKFDTTNLSSNFSDKGKTFTVSVGLKLF